MQRAVSMLVGLLFTFAIAGSALAQATGTSAQPISGHEPSTPGKSFGAGTLDLTLGGGLGDFVYPHIQPGFDFGIIPLPGHDAVSLGASIDTGWCLLCSALSLAQNYSIKSWYISPLAQANLHLGILAKAFQLPQLDPYLGIAMGPSWVHASVTMDNGSGSWSWSDVAVRAGLVAGARYLVDPNGVLLLFGELRYMDQFGLGSFTFTDSTGTVQQVGNGYQDSGVDIVLGVGGRF